MADLPPFPVDPQTLDLLDAAIRPGPEAVRSSLGELCQLMADLSGVDGPAYHPNDVIVALVDEVRRLRAKSNN
jgi:hypothetical protein